MSNDIEITSGGAEGINRIVSAIERLEAGIKELSTSSTSALKHLQESMQITQASMTTGFTALANIAKQGENKIVEAQEAGASRRLKAQAAWEAKQVVQANRYHDKVIEQELAAENKRASTLKGLIAKRDAEAYLSDQARLTRRIELQQRHDMEIYAMAQTRAREQKSIQQRRDTEEYLSDQARLTRRIELQQRHDMEIYAMAQTRAREQKSIQQRRDTEEYLSAQAQAQALIDIARKRDVELHSMRQRAAQDAASAAEKQRVLNTNFSTAGPTSQLRTAQQAQAYAGFGGNATERYGSMAASADIRALTLAHERLQQTIPGSTRATQEHNHAMRDAHGLARGLAGSLGGLWLTYGSVVPLLAGAAIAGSLKSIVEQGREVEYQLKFVQALSGEGANLNNLLQITDQTIVSVKEASEGMRALAQNGLAAQQALQILPTILNLSVIGEMSVAQAALSVTGAIAAFGLELRDADHVANVFAQTAAKSNTSVLAMTESMKQASTVASIYGATVEEAAAVMGVLAKSNITGGAAGTAYTNMLNGLYAPTEKAKKAMKELGVSADDGNGGLKTQTVLLDELRQSLAKYNESSRATLVGDIFTVRGAKSIDGILKNWDQYKTKIQEAVDVTNFMGRAVTVLEDSTTAAFQRLKNSVSSSLTQAFEKSAPPLQQMLYHLGELARSEQAVQTLTSVAQAVMRLTKVVVDNAAAIPPLIAAYVGLRVLSGLTGMIATYTTATVAATAATTAAGSAILGVAAKVRLAVAALGWIALAVSAAVAAWQLFVDKTSDVETAAVRQQNTIDATIEGLNREIEALAERNRLRDAPAAGATVQSAVDDASNSIAEHRARIKILEKRLEASGGPVSEIVMKAGELLPMTNGKGLDQGLRDRIELQKRLNVEIAAEQALMDKITEVGQKSRKLEFDSSEAAAADKRAKVEKKFRDLAKGAGQYDPNSPDFTQNENSAYVARARQSDALADQVKSGALDIREANLLYAKERGALSKLLEGRAEKPDTAGAAAARQQASAESKRLDLELQLARQSSQAAVSTARAQNKRGELGDLQLINLELGEKIKLDEKAVDVARKQAALEDMSPAKRQEATNRQTLATAQKGFDVAGAAEARKSVLDKLEQEEIEFEANIAKNRGDNADAFLAGYEAKYRNTLSNIENDILTSTDATAAARLKKHQDYLARVRDMGLADAEGQDAKASFDSTMATLQARMAELKNDASTGGLLQFFNSAKGAADAYAASLPALIAAQAQLQDTANATRDPKDQQAATSALAQIEASGERTRQVWLDVGQAIAGSLEQAFGRGGAALGTMLTASLAHADTQKKIYKDLEKARGTKDFEKTQKDASKALVANDLNTYGKMAGAAKNFFKEKTAAHKVMAGIERASIAAQTALALVAMGQELGIIATTTAAKVTAIATETGANVASVGPNVAADSAKATASGIAGVAKAIASLPFPYNLLAGAATLAALVGVGVKMGGSVGGGGSAPPDPNSMAERQKNQGTGTVFGDSSAKSESISKSLARMEENTSIALEHSSKMVAALRSIENSIGGLAAQVVASGGANGNNFGVTTGKINVGQATDAISRVMTSITNSIFGSKVSSFINNLWGKTTQEISDSGVTLGGSVRGLQSGQGYSQYADVSRTTSSWFGLSKNTDKSTLTQGLGGDLTRQFSLVFSGVEKALQLVAPTIDSTSEHVKNTLDNLALSMQTVSLKDLKGAELTEALSSIISAASDQMAEAALPGLGEFRKVGEGYFETVMRVAGDMDVAKAGLERLGMVMIHISAVTDKQADVGAELVRQTIYGYQTTGTALTGVGEIMKNLGGTAQDLLETYQELLDVQVSMRRVGLNSGQLSSSTIKGAGDIGSLQSSLDAYFDSFFTKTEKAAANSAAMAEKFGALGVAMPATADGFRMLVESIPQTTAAGQQLLGSVLSLADGFAQLHEAAGTLDPQALVDRYFAAGQALRSSLRTVGDAVQALADKVTSTTAATASARDAISQAYFTAQDKVAAAQEKVNQLVAESAKNLSAFGDSIGSFLANLDSEKGSSIRNLKLSLSENLNLAVGGNKKGQDAALKDAESLSKANKAGTGSSVVFAQTQAQLRSALGNIQASISARPGSAEDPMKVALKDLETAQLELVGYAGAAAASGANTDRSTFETAGSASSLLAAFNKAQTEEATARAAYTTALGLTSGLALTTSTALTSLVDGLNELVRNQTAFDDARDDLADYVIDIQTDAGTLNTFITGLTGSLGLTGSAADALRTALSNPATAANTLADLLGTGGLLQTNLNTFGIDIGRLAGTEGALSSIITAMTGTNAAATSLATKLGEQGLTGSINTIITTFGLLGSAAADLLDAMNHPYVPPVIPTAPVVPAPVVPAVQTLQQQVGNVYQAVLNRQGDAAGMDYWANAVGTGVVKMVDLAGILARSAADDTLDPTGRAAGWTIESAQRDATSAIDWLRKNNVPGYASGGMHGGGIRLVGENGPEVEATGMARYWNASQMGGAFRDSGSASGDSQMAAQMARMAQMMEQQQAAMEAQAKMNSETAKATRELADAFRRATVEQGGKRGLNVFTTEKA